MSVPVWVEYGRLVGIHSSDPEQVLLSCRLNWQMETELALIDGFQDIPYQPPAETNRTVRNFIFARTGGRCFYCGCLLYVNSKDYQVDHVIPRLERLDNLVPACAVCNNSKHDRPLSAFRRFVARRMGESVGGRITKVRFWFETDEGRRVLAEQHSPADLAALMENVRIAEELPPDEIPAARPRRKRERQPATP